MSEEEQKFKQEVDKTLASIYSKINEDEKIFLSYVVNQFNKVCECNNKAIECIDYYAIENEDYSKIYNDEEKELLSILKGERK